MFNKLIFIIERVIKSNLRGLALLFVLSFYSCDGIGQITVDDNGDFQFPKETVEVEVLRDYTAEEIAVIVNQYSLLDTINVSSDILYLDYTDAMQQPKQNPEYYVLIRGEGIQNVIMDSTQVWQGQKDIKLKRLKTFGQTYYELIE